MNKLLNEGGKVVGEEALVFSRSKEATAAVPRVITHKGHVTCDPLGFVEESLQPCW